MIVWELSKLTRDLTVWVDLRKACDEHSVTLTDFGGVLQERLPSRPVSVP